MKPVAPAAVLHCADAHRTLLRKDVARLLMLETERIDRLARRLQSARWVHHHDIDDTFAGAAWNRRAADVLDFDPGRDVLDEQSDCGGNVDRSRVVGNVAGTRIRVWQDRR